MSIYNKLPKKYFDIFAIHRYLRLLKKAFERLKNISHGSDEIDLEIFQIFYLQNLFALLDDSGASYSGDNVMRYAKELRHSIIHRGLETPGGHSDGKNILPILPPEVYDIKGNKISRPENCYYYIDLFTKLEEKSKPIILQRIEELKLLNEITAFNYVEYIEFINGNDIMPEFAKDMAKSIEESTLKEVHEKYNEQVKKDLNEWLKK